MKKNVILLTLTLFFLSCSVKKDNKILSQKNIPFASRDTQFIHGNVIIREINYSEKIYGYDSCRIVSMVDTATGRILKRYTDAGMDGDIDYLDEFYLKGGHATHLKIGISAEFDSLVLASKK